MFSESRGRCCHLDLMAADARWARGQSVEKRSVFAVHIFSRATPVREQSRTNGRNKVFAERSSVNNSNKQTHSNEKRTLSWTGCPQGLYHHGGSGGRAQGGSARERCDQQRFARGGKMDWAAAQRPWQGNALASVL